MMNCQTFIDSISYTSANFVSELYNQTDLPRNRVPHIVALCEEFFSQHAFTTFLNTILLRLKFLGESDGNLSAYAAMFAKFQKPFDGFRTESQCLEYMKTNCTYIPPQEVLIPVSDAETQSNAKEGNKVVSLQVIPLHKVLTKFFELPGVYEKTTNYMRELQTNRGVLRNVIQGEY